MGAADEAVPSAGVPLKCRLLRLLINRVVSATARRVLADRTRADMQEIDNPRLKQAAERVRVLLRKVVDGL